MSSDITTESHPVLETLVKRMGLTLSDRVSDQLSSLVTFKYFGRKRIPYETIQKLSQKYYTFSLLDDHHCPILNVMDKQIVYLLTNRVLGGDMVADLRPFKELFTFSETHFGKVLLGWVIEAFGRQQVSLTADKIADSPKYFHIFLPDELVWQFAFEVFSGPTQIGMYYLCFDQKFAAELGDDHAA